MRSSGGGRRRSGRHGQDAEADADSAPPRRGRVRVRHGARCRRGKLHPALPRRSLSVGTDQQACKTATELITKTLDLQGPRVDKFVPTDPSRLASLSFDPSGFLAQSLPAGPDAVTSAIGVYSARAALDFQTDPCMWPPSSPSQDVCKMPRRRCGLQRTRPGFSCYARAGRYAFNTASENQVDARERTAAQYLILERFRR